MTTDNGKVLLVGRWFTEVDLECVRDTVRMFPGLSRNELALTICENLDWKSPSGRLKVESCQQFLDLMARREGLELPAWQGQPRGREKRVEITARTQAPAYRVTGDIDGLSPIELEPVEGSSVHLWNEYVQRYHPLGYKRPFGAHQRYFIWSGKERLGCMLFAAAAWALEARDKWIGWGLEDRKQRVNMVVNNSRFLVFPWVEVRNLASKVLSVAAKQVGRDWERRYGYRPVLLETFVGQEYRGAAYRAAGWIYLGMTVGRGRKGPSRPTLWPKQIFVYPLVDDFRSYLCGNDSGDKGGGQ